MNVPPGESHVSHISAHEDCPVMHTAPDWRSDLSDTSVSSTVLLKIAATATWKPLRHVKGSLFKKYNSSVNSIVIPSVQRRYLQYPTWLSLPLFQDRHPQLKPSRPFHPLKQDICNVN